MEIKVYKRKFQTVPDDKMGEVQSGLFPLIQPGIIEATLLSYKAHRRKRLSKKLINKEYTWAIADLHRHPINSKRTGISAGILAYVSL
jgi:hypothetical protein